MLVVRNNTVVMVTLTVPQSYRRCNVRVDRLLNRPRLIVFRNFRKINHFAVDHAIVCENVRLGELAMVYTYMRFIGDVDIESIHRVLRACKFA